MPSNYRDLAVKARNYLLLLPLLLCAPLGQALAEKRIALVIGNSEYTQISALANPSRDAALMVETLTALGFEVVEARDVSRRYSVNATRQRSGGDTAAIAAYDAQIRALEVRLRQLRAQ